MKERKPLFPEYIWMFFVGLLLAIIVCMRLIPGHADYIVADNPYNDNIIFITLEGKKIHFTSFMGNEIYSTINSNNSDWTEALESDIVSYANYAKLYFGEGNFSVVVVDNYSVSYNYNRFIQLIGPIVGTIYSSYYTGPSEDFLVLNNPWASLSENTFSEYYPTLYTLNLGGYLMPYYKLDPDSLPTPTLSPTPTTEPVTENYNFIFYNLNVWTNTPYYWLVSFDAENFGKVVSVSSTPSAMFSGVVSDHELSFPVSLSGSTFSFHDQTNYDYLTLYFTADSISNVVYYNLGSSLISQDYDILKDTYSAVSFGSGNSIFNYLEDPLISGVFGFMLDDGTYKSDTLISYDFSYTYQSVGNFNSLYSALFTSDYYTNSLTYYGYSGLLGSGVDVTPSPTPTPEGWQPTSSPTPSPVPDTVIMVTPVVTPPITFPVSDLPGGASGEGGSISGAGGMNASEAESIYQYWTNKITNNQALAFLVSFFGILPFDLVYALGTIIFILILLAMVRLFIHFIS